MRTTFCQLIKFGSSNIFPFQTKKKQNNNKALYYSRLPRSSGKRTRLHANTHHQNKTTIMERVMKAGHSSIIREHGDDFGFAFWLHGSVKVTPHRMERERESSNMWLLCCKLAMWFSLHRFTFRGMH